MVTILERIVPQFELFLLVLIRISGLFFITPFFGQRNVPMVFRIGLALFVSYIVVQMNTLPSEFFAESIMGFAFILMRELFIGIVLGFVSILVFSAITMAGQIIDIHLGFGLVNIFDPQSGMQVSLMGKFKNVLAIIIFFSIEGHHTLLRLIVDSFNVLPIGGFVFSSTLVFEIVSLFTYYFTLAIQISLPIIAAAMIVEMIFGIIVRTVPQMNIFVLGIPIKIVIGLLAIYLLIPFYIGFIGDVFNEMFSAILRIIEIVALS